MCNVYMKRGEITLKLLEFVAEQATEMGDVLAVMFELRKGQGIGTLNYKLEHRRLSRRINPPESIETKRIINRYRVLFSQLKSQGLIVKTRNRDKFLVSITPKGVAKIRLLRRCFEEQLSMPPYKAPREKAAIILSFDIPEAQRRKRVWLRAVLKRLRFQMIHQSVWLGKNKLPEEFISDLERLNLVNYVEIFEINKAGSLARII